MTIQKREVFYDKTDGLVRFWDWAMVTTPLGAMVEPFLINSRTTPNVSMPDIDFTDEMSRIDEMNERSVDVQFRTLAGGEAQLHGGFHLRAGR